MHVNGCEALVTGAAGGIGAELVEALAARGARRIHAADLAAPLAGAAFPEGANVEPLALDVADEAAVQRTAEQCAGVTLVVNNAAIIAWEGMMGAPSLAASRTQFEVNFWGYLHVARAFAPVLARNGGGALVNVLSEVARVNAPFCASYSASKAAAWSATQCMRAELAAQGTHVLAVFPSSTDTPMVAGFGGEKQPPEDVARGLLDAVEAGLEDICIGAHSIQTEALMRSDPKAAEREFGALLPGAGAIPD